jgi:hypothetical protein
MRQTLKISNDETSEMAWSMSFGQLLGETLPSVAMLKRFLNQPFASDATALMTAAMETGLLREQTAALLDLLDHWRKTDFAPSPLITGDDLTAAGAPPGPKFKIALDTAYDAQLEDRISTKQQAMQLAAEILNQAGV